MLNWALVPVAYAVCRGEQEENNNNQSIQQCIEMLIMQGQSGGSADQWGLAKGYGTMRGMMGQRS
jgi:hypothetical protein